MKQSTPSLMMGLIILSLICPLSAGSKDLGTYGETFAIIEIDLLKMLGAKLKAAQDSGAIDALNQQFAVRATQHIEEPAPVAGLTNTQTPKSWLFDPSITVPRDFADQNGRVFAHAGEHINPLERLPSFNKTLVFIDAREPAQVRFALKVRKDRGPIKTLIILTQGAPLKLMRVNKVPVFYDQQGLLVKKFSITQVPAVVSREGNYLRIREVRP